MTETQPTNSPSPSQPASAVAPDNVVEEVITAFGGKAVHLQRALNHRNITTVSGWRKSGRFPDWRLAEIASAASERRIHLPQRFLDLLAQKGIAYSQPSGDQAGKDAA